MSNVVTKIYFTEKFKKNIIQSSNGPKMAIEGFVPFYDKNNILKNKNLKDYFSNIDLYEFTHSSIKMLYKENIENNLFETRYFPALELDLKTEKNNINKVGFYEFDFLNSYVYPLDEKPESLFYNGIVIYGQKLVEYSDNIVIKNNVYPIGVICFEENDKLYTQEFNSRTNCNVKHIFKLHIGLNIEHIDKVELENCFTTFCEKLEIDDKSNNISTSTLDLTDDKLNITSKSSYLKSINNPNSKLSIIDNKSRVEKPMIIFNNGNGSEAEDSVRSTISLNIKENSLSFNAKDDNKLQVIVNGQQNFTVNRGNSVLFDSSILLNSNANNTICGVPGVTKYLKDSTFNLYNSNGNNYRITVDNNVPMSGAKFIAFNSNVIEYSTKNINDSHTFLIDSNTNSGHNNTLVKSNCISADNITTINSNLIDYKNISIDDTKNSNIFINSNAISGNVGNGNVVINSIYSTVDGSNKLFFGNFSKYINSKITYGYQDISANPALVMGYGYNIQESETSMYTWCKDFSAYKNSNRYNFFTVSPNEYVTWDFIGSVTSAKSLLKYIPGFSLCEILDENDSHSHHNCISRINRCTYATDAIYFPNNRENGKQLRIDFETLYNYSVLRNREIPNEIDSITLQKLKNKHNEEFSCYHELMDKLDYGFISYFITDGDISKVDNNNIVYINKYFQDNYIPFPTNDNLNFIKSSMVNICNTTSTEIMLLGYKVVQNGYIIESNSVLTPKYEIHLFQRTLKTGESIKIRLYNESAIYSNITDKTGQCNVIEFNNLSNKNGFIFEEII